MVHRPRSSSAGHSARAGGERPSGGAAFAGMRWGPASLPGRGGPYPLLLHSSAVASGPRRPLLGAADFPSAPPASPPPAASRRRQPPSATAMTGGAQPLSAAGPAPAEGPARLFPRLQGEPTAPGCVARLSGLGEREREGRREKREGRKEGGKEGGSSVRGERLWLSAGRYRQRSFFRAAPRAVTAPGAAGARR